MNKYQEAKESIIKLAVLSSKIRNETLEKIAQSIDTNRAKIIEENKKDIEYSKDLPAPLIKRLKLDEVKINEMIDGIRSLIKQDDPNNQILSKTILDDGLELLKVTCPIGVIGAIFESRPDALVQIACLCIKSGNAVILKGGSEAINSNKILGKLISDEAVEGSVQLIETREDVQDMLKQDKYIDLLIPRGSAKFVKYIQIFSLPILLGCRF